LFIFQKKYNFKKIINFAKNHNFWLRLRSATAAVSEQAELQAQTKVETTRCLSEVEAKNNQIIKKNDRNFTF